MKTLYLIRHAKSSWDDTNQTDFERPLNKRGEHDTPIMAKVLSNVNLSSGLVISSPANRAYTTAQIFMEKLLFPSEKIITDNRIYEAGIRELMTLVREIDNRIETVLLFGHNPGLTSLTNLLGDKFIPEMPTCSIVGLKFELNTWAEVERQSGKIFLFDYPKKHSK
ncbi:phosphohistidine phosphatase [bacterium]|nr:phosphohistidine phosphatase [bacterium]